MKERKRLIMLGGGGHCQSCIDVIEATGCWEIEGIIDIPQRLGERVLGYAVIGKDADISGLVEEGRYFLVAVGQIASSGPRKRLLKALIDSHASMATVVSPLAYVSRHATVGKGSIIHHHCTVNAGTTVGMNCIVNTGSNLEHGVRIGDHTHISTGVVLNGDVSVGNDCFVGSGAVVVNGVSIADDVVVGAGSVILKSILKPGRYFGIFKGL
jgi:sugar O-acyltransferase (sialic acid O-acetyltransferase NeuD family)